MSNSGTHPSSTKPLRLPVNHKHGLNRQCPAPETSFPFIGQDNADAVVLTVSPNRAASLIGVGPAGAPLQPEFGNVDFRLYNIDVANRATVDGKEFFGQTGPSAALLVAYANASTYGSTFASYQDTLFCGRNGSLFSYGGLGGARVDGTWLTIRRYIQVERYPAAQTTYTASALLGKGLL